VAAAPDPGACQCHSPSSPARHHSMAHVPRSSRKRAAARRRSIDTIWDTAATPINDASPPTRARPCPGGKNDKTQGHYRTPTPRRHPIQRMDTYVLGPCMLISEACMCVHIRTKQTYATSNPARIRTCCSMRTYCTTVVRSRSTTNHNQTGQQAPQVHSYILRRPKHDNAATGWDGRPRCVVFF